MAAGSWAASPAGASPGRGLIAILGLSRDETVDTLILFEFGETKANLVKETADMVGVAAEIVRPKPR